MFVPKKEPAAVPAEALNHTLLRVRAWCRHHRLAYAANTIRNGRIESSPGCGRCIDEMTWVKRAHRAMKLDGSWIDSETVLERAEKLAGYPLRRYRRG